MIDDAAPPQLPKLAYVYDPLSFAPLSITTAAEGVCSLIWVVDSSRPDAPTIARMLRKFGPVIDSSTLTLGQLAAQLREHHPDGILSMHDSDLVWTAQLAALLGLPFHSHDTAIRLTDKNAQRKALSRAGVAVPPFCIIPAAATTATIREIGDTFAYPAVLKPRYGQSSRDTLPIASQAQLETTLADLRQRPGTPDEDFVLEGYVPDATSDLGGRGFASFVSVESVVENGEVAHAAVSARTPFRWPFRETGYCTPAALAPALQTEVLRLAGDAARALDISTSCLHTEIKLTDAGPVIIEVNGRPGGGMSEMLERASGGFSILRTALRLALGQRVGLTGPVACSRVGYLLYVFPQVDLEWIDSVEGLPRLREIEGIDEIVLVRGPGQRIDWREGSEAHVFHFTGTTADHDQLLQLMAAASTVVRIDGHNDPSAISE